MSSILLFFHLPGNRTKNSSFVFFKNKTTKKLAEGKQQFLNRKANRERMSEKSESDLTRMKGYPDNGDRIVRNFSRQKDRYFPPPLRLSLRAIKLLPKLIRPYRRRPSLRRLRKWRTWISPPTKARPPSPPAGFLRDSDWCVRNLIAFFVGFLQTKRRTFWPTLPTSMASPSTSTFS